MMDCWGRTTARATSFWEVSIRTGLWSEYDLATEAAEAVGLGYFLGVGVLLRRIELPAPEGVRYSWRRSC